MSKIIDRFSCYYSLLIINPFYQCNIETYIVMTANIVEEIGSSVQLGRAPNLIIYLST